MEKIVSSLSGVNKSVYLLDDQTLKIVRYSNGFSKTQKVKSEDVIAISEITHTRLIERHGKFLLCELHIESIKSRVIIDFRPSEIDAAKELVRQITPEIKNTSLDDQKPENIETVKTAAETEISEQKQNEENNAESTIIVENDPVTKTEIAEPEQSEKNTLQPGFNSALSMEPVLGDPAVTDNQVPVSEPGINEETSKPDAISEPENTSEPEECVEDDKEPPMSFSELRTAKHEVKQANKLWNNALATQSSAEKMVAEIEKVQDHLTDRKELGISKDAIRCAYMLDDSLDIMKTAFDEYMGYFGIQASKINRMTYNEFRDNMSLFIKHYDKLRTMYDQMYNDYSYLADYRRVKSASYVYREKY